MSVKDLMPLKRVLGEIMTSDSLKQDMRHLCDFIGKRPTGSTGEEEAKQFLLDRFRSFGITKVQSEPFQAPHWKRGITVAHVTSPVERTIQLLALPLCRSHKVSAPVVWAPFETEAEFREYAPSIKGKICINQGGHGANRGDSFLERAERILLAYRAGAAAFLWVSPWKGQVASTGSIIHEEVALHLPAFGITSEDALLLKRLIDANQGDVQVEIETDNVLSDGVSWNISAELDGSDENAPLVVLTAHYDSHDITEGAFDNAAGCAVVLECARALTLYYSNTGCRIRFIVFSAEEVGLVGSRCYVREHLDELGSIRFLLNADGLGVTPSTKYIHVPFGTNLVEYIKNAYGQLGYSVEVENALHLGWDHAPFVINGVPVGSITAKWPAGDLLHYGHTAADSLDKIDFQDMRYVACCAAALVYQVATNSKWTIEQHSPGAFRDYLEHLGKLFLLDRFDEVPQLNRVVGTGSSETDKLRDGY